MGRIKGAKKKESLLCRDRGQEYQSFFSILKAKSRKDDLALTISKQQKLRSLICRILLSVMHASQDYFFCDFLLKTTVGWHRTLAYLRYKSSSTTLFFWCLIAIPVLGAVKEDERISRSRKGYKQTLKIFSCIQGL